MRRPTRFLIAAVVVGAIGAGAFFAVRAIGNRDDSGRAAAFFTVPTQRSCAPGTLDISIGHAGFAASFQGKIPSEGGKFLLVTVDAVNHADAARASLRPSFRLQDRSGGNYAAEDVTGQWGPVGPRESAEGTLAFSLPLATDAVKLVYDDGCTHAEWVVP
jgi:hypothetical protein